MAEETSVHSQFQSIGNLRHDLRPLHLDPAQRRNIRRMAFRQMHRIKPWAACAMATVAVESLLPLIYSTLARYRYHGWSPNETLLFSGCMLLAVIAFAAMRWMEIYLEKLLCVEWLNDLRRCWYREYLKRDGRESVIANLVPKITYHFGLLQIGLRGALFMSIKWCTACATLLVVSALLGLNLFFVAVAGIGMCLILAGGSFFIARHFVSQDKTLYSRMLRDMVAALEDTEVHRRLDSRRQLLSRFDRLVELDTFFRVRREMWVRLGNLTIIVALMAMGPVFFAARHFFPDFAGYLSVQGLTFGLLTAVLVRMLHMAVSIGMFGFPLYLGLCLVVPSFPMQNTDPRWDRIRSVVFRAKSVKPTRDGKRCNVDLAFNAGDCMNIEAGTQARDFCRLLTGRYASREGKPWTVIHNGERFSYNTWKMGARGIWHVSPLFTTRLPIISLLTGCCEDQVDANKLNDVLSRLDGLPHLDELGIEAAHMRSPTIPEMRGWSWLMAVQILAVITQQPELIVVDEALLKTTDPVLRDLIRQIPKRCPQSIVIAFNDETEILSAGRSYALVA